MSTRSSPVSASAIRPGPTSSPASRRTRPNVTTWRTKPPSGSACCRDRARLLDEGDEGLVADRSEILVVLQDRAERLLHGSRIEVLPSKGRERLCPVDRLGDTRRLREIESAQPLHERGRLRGKPVGKARDAQRYDLDLALERRVPDPVEEAATLQRVVELARAVGGQDHGRPPVRGDRSDLGNRDLEVRKHLEQEGFELVV